MKKKSFRPTRSNSKGSDIGKQQQQQQQASNRPPQENLPTERRKMRSDFLVAVVGKKKQSVETLLLFLLPGLWNGSGGGVGRSMAICTLGFVGVGVSEGQQLCFLAVGSSLFAGIAAATSLISFTVTSSLDSPFPRSPFGVGPFVAVCDR